METINLINNKGFSWFSIENIFIKGCFFDGEDNYYEKEKALLFFRDIDSVKQFIKRIKSVNGIFTAIVKIENMLCIASDSTRIFPLFYSLVNNKLSISDDILFLKKELGISEIDEQSAIDFNASNCTMGKKTLLKHIFQLQSNEYLVFNKNIIKKKAFFFNYATKKKLKDDYAIFKEKAINVFDDAFKRLITSLNHKPVAIPLSGGYDSRLIAVMLKKYNYKNVTCYTYGKKDNLEIENSKKTADELGFKWIFVEYTDELIGNYIESDVFKDFAHYSGKFTSMPSLQDYFAVKYLTDNNLIKRNTIFIPGYAGDSMAGSQYLKVIPENLQTTDLSSLILRKKFHHNKTSNKSKKKIAQNLKKLLYSFDKNYENKIASSVYENYDVKEIISKFIFKAANLYTFFGYEHRFPYWDKELLTFFKNVPIEYKKMKILYNDVLTNHYFETFNVNYEKELQPSLINIYLQKIKENIKPLLPYIIINKLLIKNDWLNSESITKQMINSMNKNNLPINTKIHMYNELNIQWYLYFCKGLIKK